MNISQVANVRIPKEKLLAALGLPASAVIMLAWVDDGNPLEINNVWFQVAHDKLKPVDVGAQVPEVTPRFEVVQADVKGDSVDVVRLIDWGKTEVGTVSTR